MTRHAIAFIEPDAHPELNKLIRLVIDSELGAVDPHAPAMTVSPNEWAALWAQVRKHRIGPLLSGPLRREELDLPQEATRAVADHARLTAMLRLRLNAALRRQLALLGDAGIEVRVLKGLATGPLDYAAEASRHTADVDLLVPERQFEAACEVLRSATPIELKPDHPAHLLVERTFRDEDGIEIDLHHRLFRFGGAESHVLFENPVDLPHGFALPAEARLVHAAAHLLIAPPGRSRLSSLIDVAVLSAMDRTDIDLAKQFAGLFGVEDLLDFALWLTQSIGIDDHEPAPKPSTLIGHAYLRPRRNLPLETLAVLADLDGLQNKFDYVRFQLSRDR